MTTMCSWFCLRYWRHLQWQSESTWSSPWHITHLIQPQSHVSLAYSNQGPNQQIVSAGWLSITFFFFVHCSECVLEGLLKGIMYTHWLCSHGLESCSERRFGSRSKTWLGSWFELRAFTCIANAFPITIRICALRGNILFLLRKSTLIDPCMASARISKMYTHKSRFERALHSHVLESGFLGGSQSKTPLFSRFKTRFKSLIWNSFAFTWAKIRLSNQERAESHSETSFGTWF